jgi:hypothetical protein
MIASFPRIVEQTKRDHGNEYVEKEVKETCLGKQRAEGHDQAYRHPSYSQGVEEARPQIKMPPKIPVIEDLPRFLHGSIPTWEIIPNSILHQL